MSASQLLLNPKRNLDDKSEKYAKMILDSCKRAADITSRLLKFSRKDKASFESIQLDSIVEEVIGLLKHTIKKSISIEYNSICKSLIVNGDASAIQSVLLNLSINSDHAIKDKGQITFELSERFLDQEYCEQSNFKIQSGSFNLIKLRDTGSGIHPENIDKMFEAFFTTKENGLGTGLGLSSVLTIMEDHHGAIEVESIVGKGTTFSLLFPKI